MRQKQPSVEERNSEALPRPAVHDLGADRVFEEEIFLVYLPPNRLSWLDARLRALISRFKMSRSIYREILSLYYTSLHVFHATILV